MHRNLHPPARVVISGGGAGGLMLACRLGRSKQIDVSLVERSESHLWKPLLHEAAAGTLNVGQHEVDYFTLARRHGFRFVRGALDGLDRSRREVLVSPVSDVEGAELIPARRLPYDLAVIAVGAVSNDFGIPGATDIALPLDHPPDAERIRRTLLNESLRANYGDGSQADRLRVTIVGGGATGVELAAELREMNRALVDYGLDRIDRDRYIAITLFNADPRLLPQLPERISTAVTAYLAGLGVELRNGETVARIERHGLVTRSGAQHTFDLAIWAAGVKAPAITRRLDGLETNHIGQLLVDGTLRTLQDRSILAFGDCAACPWPGHVSPVPPRAQAAHQQAIYLARSIPRLWEGAKEIDEFQYRDFGSLVSLGSDQTAIGTLMGLLTGRSLRVEGLLAKTFYKWLYLRHRAALFGWPAAVMEGVGNWIGASTRPRIKLH